MSQLPGLMPGAEPFLYHGEGRVGCVCLHGLGASPDEVRWFGMALAERGITTYGPRLAGHGTDYHDLRRVTWQDWLYSALDAYELMKRTCDIVTVAGLSMGGLLTLMLAAHESVEIAGAVVMATPLHLTGRRIHLVRWLKTVQPYFDTADRSDFPARLKAEQARRGETPHGRVRYDQWAGQAVLALQGLIRVVNEVLPQIETPMLALYSRGDATVPYDNLAHLTDRASRSDVESYSYTESGHILTQDVDHADVAARAAAFILKTTAEPTS